MADMPQVYKMQPELMFPGFHGNRVRGRFWKPFGLHLETILGAVGLQLEVMFDPGGVFLRFLRLSKIGSKSCDFQDDQRLSQASHRDTIHDFQCYDIRELEQQF